MPYSSSKAQAGRGTQASIGPQVGASPVVFTATTSTSGSPTNLTSASSIVGLVPGMILTGAGIPANTTIISASGSTVIMSNSATASASGVSITATGPFVLIGEVDSSPFSGRKWNFEDSSNFQSPVDMESLQTMRDPGTVPLTGNRVSSDAGQAALEAACDSGGLFTFKIVLPLGAGQTTIGDTWTFNAFVASYDPSKIDTKSIIKFAAELKISGTRTLTLGS